MQNCIADKAAEKYHAHYGRNPGNREYRSWQISLSILNNSSKNGSPILLSDKFYELVKEFPLFAKEDSIELSRYLKDRLGGGGGRLLYERFSGSPIGPSKRLLEHTSDMINKQQIFNLID